MKFKIHRGTREIGGSCVEVMSGKSRIVIDLGMPLVDPQDKTRKLSVGPWTPASRLRELGILPQIPGLWKDLNDGPRVDAVLLSHPHQDHHGLLRLIRRDMPVYLSADALRILVRSDYFLPPGAQIRNARFFNDRQPKVVEGTPFLVTPYLMDHSGYGALAFCVEADGRKLFYSGDFRGHGRKAALFFRLCEDPPKGLDRMLVEGTTLGGSGHACRTETALEGDMMRAFETYRGLKLISVSAQNIDRIVTIYRACVRSQKVLVMDLYTAAICEGTRRSSIPHPGPDWTNRVNLRVIFHKRYKDKLEKHHRFKEVLGLAEPFLIEPAEIAADPGRHVMLFRESLMDEFKALGDWGQGIFIHSLWEGYQQEPSFIRAKAETDRRGMGFAQIHTSGHASKAHLGKLAQALKPRKLSIMHSFHGEEGRDLYDPARVECLEDKKEYDV